MEKGAGMKAKGFVVVMGVSGSGKTTVARELAARLSVPFLEGDDYHPQENIAAMAAGRPLNDEMRLPWLRRLAEAALAEAATGRGPVILACSALKRRYREYLASRLSPILFLHLAATPEVIRERLLARSAHFMPASLLASQFADLERPEPAEPAVEIDMTLPPAEILRLGMDAIAKL